MSTQDSLAGVSETGEGLVTRLPRMKARAEATHRDRGLSFVKVVLYILWRVKRLEAPEPLEPGRGHPEAWSIF